MVMYRVLVGGYGLMCCVSNGVWFCGRGVN